MKEGVGRRIDFMSGNIGSRSPPVLSTIWGLGSTQGPSITDFNLAGIQKQQAAVYYAHSTY